MAQLFPKGAQLDEICVGVCPNTKGRPSKEETLGSAVLWFACHAEGEVFGSWIPAPSAPCSLGFKDLLTAGHLPERSPVGGGTLVGGKGVREPIFTRDAEQTGLENSGPAYGD